MVNPERDGSIAALARLTNDELMKDIRSTKLYIADTEEYWPMNSDDIKSEREHLERLHDEKNRRRRDGRLVG